MRRRRSVRRCFHILLLVNLSKEGDIIEWEI